MHVTNQAGAVITTGEVIIIGTDKSAMLDAKGYALVDHVPFGSQTVSVSTPVGVYTNTYDLKKGKSLTLHVKVGATIETTTVRIVETTETTVEK